MTVNVNYTVPVTEAEEEAMRERLAIQEYEAEVQAKLDSEKRTPHQNAAMHTWFRAIAYHLNSAGYSVQDTVTLPISWSENMVKEILFQAIMKRKTGKVHTRELTKEELQACVQDLELILAEKFGLDVGFPHRDNK